MRTINLRNTYVVSEVKVIKYKLVFYLAKVAVGAERGTELL